MAWVTPKLDKRTPDEIYQAALAAARGTMPQWALGFGPAANYFDREDVGLVLFKLFGELFQKLSGPLNGVPGKYALAFWDFMGVTLRAPKAAEAPVAFVTNGSQPVKVPARTQIIATSAPGIVFETLDELSVLPLTIAAAYGVRPAADAYADYSAQVSGDGAPFSLSSDDENQKPFAHAIYISDPSFDFAGQTGDLSLTFEGANLYPRFFAQWTNVAGTPLKPEFTVAGYDTLTLTFANLPDLISGEVDEADGVWIVAKPAVGVSIVEFLSGTLPQIYSVAAKVTLHAVVPDKAFFNTQSLDLKNGCRPFGITPALQDAFYIGSNTVFSRTQADIVLNFDLEPIIPPEPVQLAWEFWNGSEWQDIEVVDTTANLTASGTVRFACPQISETAVNNVDNHWIRARIAGGGYGQKPGIMVTESAADVVDNVIAPFVSDKPGAIAALKKDGINFGYVYQPATYTPPFIHALHIDCVTVTRPDQIIALNGFTYEPLRTNPYTPPAESTPTFYLGLDARNFADAVAGRRLTLFFAPASTSVPLSAIEGRGSTSMRLSYPGPSGWEPLEPIRTGGRVSREGILELRIPSNFEPTAMFGQTLRWLRVETSNAAAGPQQQFIGIFVNVMAAFNAVSHFDAILGSSTGAPDQIYAFPQKPILSGPVVEVYEPVPVLAAADDAAAAADAPLPEADATADTGNIKQAWVSWREVSNFDFSTPFSRHYTLDHTNGQLAFGDGQRGSIPPKGNRNIRATAFQSGGGVQGNLAADTLNTLQKAIPAIVSVTNVLAAVGGVTADTPSELPFRAPGEIRSQGLGVTAADLVNLAISASQDVARAACLDLELGRIRVVVLPDDVGQTPTPSFDLLSTVGDYIKPRILPLLRGLIVMEGPDYVEIPASFSIILAAGASPDTVRTAIIQAYAAFLNPLSGGRTGQGWPFGSRITAAAVANLAQSISGVGYVDGVSLGADQTAVNLGPGQLPTPGAIDIVFINADAL